MQHHHKEKLAPIRWGIIMKAVFASCAVALVVFAVWYAALFAVPAWQQEQHEQALEPAAIQFLMSRVTELERSVNLPTSTTP